MTDQTNATKRNAATVTFRDEVARSIAGSMFTVPSHYADADDVLSSPSMKAIRDALSTLERLGGPGYLDYLEIPASVIEWVAGQG